MSDGAPAPSTIVSLGIDPGLRDTGIGAVERFPDGSYRTRGVRCSHTEPTKDKAFTRYRSSADEQRRLREHWVQIRNAIQLLQPNVIGIENYLVFEPIDVAKLREASSSLLALFGGATTLGPQELSQLLQDAATAGRLLEYLRALAVALQGNNRDSAGLGNAAKTIAVYGAALGAAFSAGVPVLVFEPSDRVQKIGGRRGASKEEVGAAVEARVFGLRETIHEKVTQKTRHQHVWDATAFAILAAEEYVQMRFDVGFTTPSPQLV